jgi:hypothetical protein
MSWQPIIILAAIYFLSLLAVVRTYPRRRWVTALVLFVPVLFFTLRWASYRSSWLELVLGAGIGLSVLVAWWLILGRRLPTPDENSIRVWTEEDPF